MIVPPALLRAIVRGAKTQNRVLVRDPEPRRRSNDTTYLTQPFKPTVGQRLPVQSGAGHTAGAKVIVTEVRRELLADLTLTDARAEGFRTRAEFASYWMRRYDRAWPPIEEGLCTVCDGTAELQDGAPCEECDLGTIDVEAIPDEDTILERFARSHGHHLVWVITFEVEQDTPLFLHKDPARGYTTNPGEALRDEPEVLGPPSPGWRERATARHRAAQRDTRASRLSGLPDPGERLRVLRKLAGAAGVNVTPDLNAIDRRLDAIEAKVAAKTDRRAA